MTVTPKKLSSAAGLAAVAAGLIFMLIQFVHPSENATTVTTVEWVVVSGLTATMAILAGIGVSAMYLRSVQRMGVIGLVGYVLFATCFVAITAVGYLLGGLLFGIALFRARVARGAALLLAAASIITVLVPVLPHAFERLLALPMGVALAALGYSLWSRERAVPSQPDIETDREPRTSARAS